MLVDCPHILLKQFRDLRLREPDRFVFKPALDARPAILGLLENGAGLRQRIIKHEFFLEITD